MSIMSRINPQRPHQRRLRLSQIGLHLIIISLLILSLIPSYLLVSMSFKTGLQYRWERWVVSFPLRLRNYMAAWDIVGDYMVNTTIVAFTGLAGVLLLSLVGGYVFARMAFPFKEPLYFAIIALLMVPGILSFIPSYMVYVRLGLLNSRWGLILPNLAGGPIFGIFLMRAFISGIPEEIYEAARCDGAGALDLILRVTLPLSLPGLATLSVLNFIGTWNSFLWPLVMINSDEKQMIAVGLYKLSQAAAGGYYESMDYGAWGPVFAGYMIASIPLAVLFVSAGKFYVEGLVESGLKV